MNIALRAAWRNLCLYNYACVSIGFSFRRFGDVGGGGNQSWTYFTIWRTCVPGSLTGIPSKSNFPTRINRLMDSFKHLDCEILYCKGFLNHFPDWLSRPKQPAYSINATLSTRLLTITAKYDISGNDITRITNHFFESRRHSFNPGEAKTRLTQVCHNWRLAIPAKCRYLMPQGERRLSLWKGQWTSARTWTLCHSTY